ncbi:MAG: bifunctional phosphopantothenoylcysteine decarboxylase/phosphopantothenate--cysteine ligase CoaBC [Propionibacteriaceae bacterium]|nr:bifunctional phosphopantothenoylcysteine decarboxylase/phosphopantothenate--cysteine ligase CoaBC [Propionibacteriaceae bacterium]
MSRIVLGVTGGIAAYKSCYLLRTLVEAGHQVNVVPTVNALNFVGKTTWEALSGHEVATEVWGSSWEVPHVQLGQDADLVVIAPATADFLAKATAGLADDLLTNVLLTATCPVVFVPAMHTQMWQNPATVANVRTLRARGYVVMEPAAGRLTGADSGAGRMPEPDEIAEFAVSVLESPEMVKRLVEQDLSGYKVVVNAGGTREALDPVRYISNASSGKMGYALARAARQRGAQVQVVAANVSLRAPAGVDIISVVSTQDLADAMFACCTDADVVIMAAAPADFTPVAPNDSKIKKDTGAGLSLELKQTTDVLATYSAGAPSTQIVVGFAAETANSQAELLELGRNKLAKKGCSALVLNNVSGGSVFGTDENDVLIIDTTQREPIPAQGSKDLVAHAILNALQLPFR